MKHKVLEHFLIFVAMIHLNLILVEEQENQ